MATTVRKLLYLNDRGIPEELPSGAEAVVGRLDMTGDSNGIAADAGGAKIQNLADPTSPQDAATKAYADHIAQGIIAKGSVRALADSNVALTGLQTIDGVSLVDGDRVLLTGQTDPKQNGVWVVHSGAYTRPNDFATGTDVKSFAMFVEEGQNYHDQGWVCTSDKGSDVVDTNDLSFTQYTGTGEITFAPNTGLSKANNVISLAFGKGIFYDGQGVAVHSDEATIAADTTSVRVIGLPSNPTIGGTATTHFSATNINALIDGGYADAQHKHKYADQAKATVTHTASSIAPTPAAGTPLYGTSSGLAMADAADQDKSSVLALAIDADNILTSGVCANCLSGATIGQLQYLAVGGGITSTPPVGAGNTIYRLGFAVSATDMVFLPQYLGRRAAT